MPFCIGFMVDQQYGSEHGKCGRARKNGMTPHPNMLVEMTAHTLVEYLWHCGDLISWSRIVSSS